MGMYSWDLDGGFNVPLPKCVPGPRLTVRCEYPDTSLLSIEVRFRLSRRYGIHSVLGANQWFLDMLREHEEFEVETEKAGEPPMPFCSETVRRVVVE